MKSLYKIKVETFKVKREIDSKKRVIFISILIWFTVIVGIYQRNKLLSLSLLLIS